MEQQTNSPVDVSIAIPVYNAERWLDECLQSVLQQNVPPALTLELSVFLDSCTDSSQQLVNKWTPLLIKRGINVIIGVENNHTPKGVGYAKNKAVQQSTGWSICFMDADDVMHADRLMVQHRLLQRAPPSALVGSCFSRSPEGSTVRYTRWANTLSPEQLHTQVFTSHGPTVIMPTWCCRRSLYDDIGGFSEKGKGEPEDLLFFYSHLRRGGTVIRADQCLLLYRYHDNAATLSVSEGRIWDVRVKELQSRVLDSWPSFTIWNAGKQGRRLYRSLQQCNRDKVVSFCDVDAKKIGKHYTFEDSHQIPKPKIPIIHFKDAQPPFIICVKLDLTGGQFEENLRSLNLLEGKDFYHFN